MLTRFENTKPPIKRVKSLSVSTLNSNFFFFFYKTRWYAFSSAIKGTNCSIARERRDPFPPRVKIFSAWKAINFRVERELQSFSYFDSAQCSQNKIHPIKTILCLSRVYLFCRIIYVWNFYSFFFFIRIIKLVNNRIFE